MTLAQFSLVIIVHTPCISSGHSLRDYRRAIILLGRTERASRLVETQLQFRELRSTTIAKDLKKETGEGIVLGI
jgi:hypothetical protein